MLIVDRRRRSRAGVFVRKRWSTADLSAVCPRWHTRGRRRKLRPDKGISELFVRVLGEWIEIRPKRLAAECSP
jgi:hypothetical protein